MKRESAAAGLLACLIALLTIIAGSVSPATPQTRVSMMPSIEMTTSTTIEPPAPTITTEPATTTTVVKVQAPPIAEPVIAASPTTTEPPAPEPVAFIPSTDVEGVICEVFGENCAAAIRVASCESGLNPANVSGSRPDGIVAPGAYHGLFQVSIPGHREMVHAWGEGLGIGAVDEAVFDPYVNAQIALSLSRGGTTWTQHFPICGRQA